MIGRALATAALVLAGLVAHAAPAHADEAEARRLFENALEALEQGRAAEGRDLLRRSIELHPTLAARVNLAIALRRTGEPVEAMAVLEELLEGRHGRLSPAQRRRIEEQRDLARAEVATLHVSVRGPPSAPVEIDGEPSGTALAGEPLSVTVSPGRHVVAAAADGFAPARVGVRVEAGRTEEVALLLTSRAPVGPSLVGTGEAGANIEDDAGGSGGGVPLWVWIAGGAVLAAAGVVAVVLLIGGDESEPTLGTFVTLRGP